MKNLRVHYEIVHLKVKCDICCMLSPELMDILKI